MDDPIKSKGSIEINAPLKRNFAQLFMRELV